MAGIPKLCIPDNHLKKMLLMGTETALALYTSQASSPWDTLLFKILVATLQAKIFTFF